MMLVLVGGYKDTEKYVGIADINNNRIKLKSKRLLQKLSKQREKG